MLSTWIPSSLLAIQATSHGSIITVPGVTLEDAGLLDDNFDTDSKDFWVLVRHTQSLVKDSKLATSSFAHAIAPHNVSFQRAYWLPLAAFCDKLMTYLWLVDADIWAFASRGRLNHRHDFFYRKCCWSVV
jgi:hypothetical protein